MEYRNKTELLLLTEHHFFSCFFFSPAVILHATTKSFTTLADFQINLAETPEVSKEIKTLQEV